jgi:hypothetical protein
MEQALNRHGSTKATTHQSIKNHHNLPTPKAPGMVQAWVAQQLLNVTF